MEYRALGSGSLRVSALAVGAWELGGRGPLATDDPQQIDAVVGAALDAGINLFDTAELYGLGRSEEALGRALHGRRDRALIATKFRDFDRWDRDDILARLEASLRRLQTDRVDLYQIHWPKRDMTAADLETFTEAFAEAKRRGLIVEAGVSNFRLEHLRDAPREFLDLVVSNQIPYSLLTAYDDVDALAAFCRAHGIAFLAYGPLAQGWLAGKVAPDRRPTDGPLADSRWARELWPAVSPLLAELHDVAGACAASVAETALMWLLGRENLASAIVGSTRPEHVRANLGAVGRRLDPDLAARLDRAAAAFRARAREAT